MPLKSDTVAVPFASGVSPQTRARLLAAKNLLTAQNCFFLQDEGPQKRFGHTSKPVRTSADPTDLGGIVPPTPSADRTTFSTSNPGIAPSWLYGWGIYSTSQVSSVAGPLAVSPQPNVGVLQGSAQRDNEVLAWDGFRLFSYAPSQSSHFGEIQSDGSAAVSPTRGPAVLPSMRAQTVAKIADAQIAPDGADNGTVRVAAWLNATGTTGFYSVYDTANKACLTAAATFSFSAAKQLRCICVGQWFHIIVSDTVANNLIMNSFHQDNPTIVTQRSLGPVDTWFDVKKIDEQNFAVVKNKTGVITAILMKQDGSATTSFIPDLGGQAATSMLACEFNSLGVMGLTWLSTPAGQRINFRTYNQAGGSASSLVNVATPTTTRRLTLAPRVVPFTTGLIWDIYVESLVSSIATVTCYGVPEGGTVQSTIVRNRMMLASHAFRVGNRTFVWCVNWLSGAIGLQTTWFLCDSILQPVGKLAYGQAAPQDFSATTNALASVNWHTDDILQLYKDRVVFHGALPYNLRVPTAGSTASPNGVFTEASIYFYELDFLPKLRSGQAGRSTYFAGAQLWACDGTEVTEAGFNTAPEGVFGTATGSGGSLSAGVYRFRVDICHKNAQNEEVRSWSIITSPVTAVNNDKITVTIPVVPMTRREDAYMLIFRTEANGTVYYLTNSRDPANAAFVKNDQSLATLTYQDGLSDANLRVREYHPANTGGNYLDPLPAPACELVAAGRDRLWLAGGELAPGEIAPSRLFFPGQAPAFSPALNIQVDRNSEPITAIGFVGELAAVFRRTSTYIIESDGPDNNLQGAWAPPRLSVADAGALGPEGLAITVAGLWFQSPAGLRRLNNGGGMDPDAGHEVELLTRTSRFSGAIVVPQYSQVRWYSSSLTSPSVVYNYQTGAWATWTIACSGVIFWPVTQLAVLARGNGELWTESQDVSTDGGSGYEMIVRTAWLHGGDLGDFQRLRKVALFGEATTPTTGLPIRVRIYYDERSFFEEEITRTFLGADNSIQQGLDNSTGWGAGTWGSGLWGDNIDPLLANDTIFFRDGVFRWQFRPHRQKCSVFSLEFSDLSATVGSFEPVVIAFELARKPGLDRIPGAGQTSLK